MSNLPTYRGTIQDGFNEKRAKSFPYFLILIIVWIILRKYSQSDIFQASVELGLYCLEFLYSM